MMIQSQQERARGIVDSENNAKIACHTGFQLLVHMA